MDIESPKYVERPIRILQVLFSNGQSDVVTLEAGDTFTTSMEFLVVDAGHETITYSRQYIACYRLIKTTAKRKVEPTKVGSGT